MVFLDLKKAFDELIMKYFYLIFALLKSYLADYRAEECYVNGSGSTNLPLKCGKILDPLLFLFFLYTPNQKKAVFRIVELCIAYCCIPRPQSTMDVTNFK